jgi:hypothetical protein
MVDNAIYYAVGNLVCVVPVSSPSLTDLRCISAMLLTIILTFTYGHNAVSCIVAQLIVTSLIVGNYVASDLESLLI